MGGLKQFDLHCRGKTIQGHGKPPSTDDYIAEPDVLDEHKIYRIDIVNQTYEIGGRKRNFHGMNYDLEKYILFEMFMDEWGLRMHDYNRETKILTHSLQQNPKDPNPSYWIYVARVSEEHFTGTIE